MKLALFVALVAVIGAVSATSDDVDAAWNSFKANYKKQYRSLYQETVHKTIFKDNFNLIVEHNKLYDQGLETYSLAINQFADMTNEEITNTLNGYKKSIKDVGKIDIETFVPNPKIAIPDEFDWREKGAVTPIKDQGRCGSCWTFSSTGALEGQYFLKTGKLASISEQNLVDCSFEFDNAGCDGGDMNAAFTYIHNNDGIDSEESYPYQGKDLQCRYKLSANVTSAKGYANIESGNEEHLKAAIVAIGPIAVAIDASERQFNSYKKGIYYNSRCTSIDDELDHAVLAVGYGSENGQDYWLVKNSWGTDWGEEGYIKMARNRNNNCGIATAASYPIVY